MRQNVGMQLHIPTPRTGSYQQEGGQELLLDVMCILHHRRNTVTMCIITEVEPIVKVNGTACVGLQVSDIFIWELTGEACRVSDYFGLRWR